MRSSLPIALALLLLAACGTRDGAQRPAPVENEAAATATKATAPGPAARWDLQSSGEGVALVLMTQPDRAVIRFFCPAGQDRLLVNVPAFRPIGSEERLSFGSGGNAAALVADPRGDRQRGGVSAAAAVPDDLKGLLEGPVSASYGAQRSGPHPAPPEQATRPFVVACNEGASAARQAASRPTAATSPCLVQDGELLRLTPLRAVGTEPFWAARVEGRCVTYSHPEDQDGTRVWTRFTPGPDGGIWVGALGGRRFELRTRPAAPGCSDGMSDEVYPFSAELLVNGERRRGCAEPPGQ